MDPPPTVFLNRVFRTNFERRAHLPGRSGFEVLEWLRQQPQFQALPVVVLTASCQDSDVKKAKRMQANEFVTKPANMFQSGDVLQGIKDRWLAAP